MGLFNPPEPGSLIKTVTPSKTKSSKSDTATKGEAGVKSGASTQKASGQRQDADETTSDERASED